MSVVYKHNGKEITKKQFDALPKKPIGAPMVPNTYRAHDPLLSDGIGVMKSQVGEMRRVIKKYNIKGVTVRDSGQLEITSRRGRRDLLRVRGLVDADAGYGDI